MKSIIKIKYPLSKTELVFWQLHIDTKLSRDYLQFTVEAYKDNSMQLIRECTTPYDNFAISGDDSDEVINQFAFTFISDLNMPELMAHKSQDELARQLNELATFQRNHRLNILKQNSKIIDGEQLHHVAYLESANV